MKKIVNENTPHIANEVVILLFKRIRWQYNEKKWIQNFQNIHHLKMQRRASKHNLFILIKDYRHNKTKVFEAMKLVFDKSKPA